MSDKNIKFLIATILSIVAILFGFDLSVSNENNSEQVEETQYEEGDVVRIVDGDTVVVFTNNQKTKVRLIGVNTPETVDPRKEVECFGQEASDFLKNILSDKKVELEIDETQGTYDKYERMLAYIFLNGENINQKIIEEGYGYEYTYSVPYKYQESFKMLEAEAKENKIGLWGEACQSY
ncbi:thermonuclease family protein [Candidatus Nomurabacteria bacterium]|nr:thermonuclease family protein [Candidatus Nomurabacteria bacterium]